MNDDIVRQMYASQGRIQEFAKGGAGPSRFLPLLFSPFPLSLPLEIVPLKPARGSGEHCKLPQRGPGRSPGRKRILCTLKLSEATGGSHFE